MRRTAAAAAATRRDIMKAARRAFIGHGFAATSTTAVARAAGVTRGALYHHFAHKSELFRAVFEELERELNEAVVNAARGAEDALGAFVAGCSALLDFAVRPDYQRIAVVEAPAVLGVAEWRRIDTDIGMATMTAGLHGLQRAGVLRRPATPAFAVLMFGALTEAALALARDAGADKEQLLDEFVSLVTAPAR